MCTPVLMNNNALQRVVQSKHWVLQLWRQLRKWVLMTCYCCMWKNWEKQREMGSWRWKTFIKVISLQGQTLLIPQMSRYRFDGEELQYLNWKLIFLFVHDWKIDLLVCKMFGGVVQTFSVPRENYYSCLIFSSHNVKQYINMLIFFTLLFFFLSTFYKIQTDQCNVCTCSYVELLF